jgi:copper resistance protein D
MHVYLISVWLHIMAAVVWVGGTIFLVIVLVPAIRRPQFAAVASALIRFTALRFRCFGWFCFGVFVLTGIVNLVALGIGWQ